jgi:hypothetical protein
MLGKIVSGGQTGVDRAALDAAMQAGVRVGGWCPRGRRATDGPISARYPLRETPDDAYAQRTSWNVRDSDATLILCTQAPREGTAFTLEEAQRMGRPVLVLDPAARDAVGMAHAWITEHAIGTLNVAGPREEEAPGMYEAARAFVRALLLQWHQRVG